MIDSNGTDIILNNARCTWGDVYISLIPTLTKWGDSVRPITPLILKKGLLRSICNHFVIPFSHGASMTRAVVDAVMR